MRENLSAYLEFAAETAFLAGRLTLGYFQTGLRPMMKADDTPVTVADRQAEALIRQRIEQHYPDHTIVGEEYGITGRADSPCRWYVDPIDGTKSFTRGVPLYAVLLGLEIEGEVEVGAVYFPALDEMLVAASGLGCWWNGRRARVSQVTRLAEATVAFTDIRGFEAHGRAKAWQRIMTATRFQAGWGDAYGHALVATGRVEIMLDPIMSDWDCGPFPPILREAGGYFGDWSGNPTIHAQEALSTTYKLLPQVLNLIEASETP